ncbi:ubiquitin interaction motif protein [Colletotrichum karsti]|uniref:Ubiquitin interaction motif protein n=1 Tax=Colletotrichum karsti TaxID=1095194 RepID=A0A9P6LPQ7_9PEZI|nr:ubiquitin interaction motif protein [Colletotrichum karsti]KAF9881205.1 ubiquitin interaction motif protein [Colletotrichum karsti]
MASEPSPDRFKEFVEFTWLDPEEDLSLIMAALKSSSTASQLAGEYWDGPDAFRNKYRTQSVWDESAFSAGRDGEKNSTGIAFNIEAPDNPVIDGITPSDGYHGTSAGAPSRPPSRTNNRSPLGAPSNSAQEEEDLQRALRESAAGSGATPQEAGVTNTGTQATYFGPANRTDYDQSSWAMVTTSGNTSQAVAYEIPLPSGRKREPGEPAFLIQQPNSRHSQHRLGSILTILHGIPQARNVLLAAGEQARNYGFNREWWNGQRISAEAQFAGDSEPDFHQEIHRLMAFLDGTHRSYGSVEAMADLVPEPEPGNDTTTTERQFWDTLNAKTDPETMKPLIHRAYPIYIDTLEPAGDESTRFAYLNFQLPKNQYEHTKTLYEVWDWLVWSDPLTWQEFTPGSKMVVLSEMGEVITFLLDGDTPETIDIPEVWYPERYLEHRKNEARVIQEHIIWVLDNLFKAREDEYNSLHWLDGNKPYDKREMLEKTIKEYEGQVRYLDGLGRFRELQKSDDGENAYTRLEEGPSILTEEEGRLSQTAKQVVARCKQLLSEIDSKLAKIKWELERLNERQRFLGRILTDPQKSGNAGPFNCKKYHLRGVSTGKNTTYVCRRTGETSLEDIYEGTSQNDQWWRLSYTAGDKNPVKTEKVSLDLVMRQMFQETKNPMLVYATEDAVTQPKMPLSSALETFVLAENKTFAKDLALEEVTEEDGNATNKTNEFTSPRSPASPNFKRKFSSGSVDSLDSNRASNGDSERGSRDADFEARSFGIGDAMDTEMAEIPQSSVFDTSNNLTETKHSGEIQQTAESYDTQLAAPQQMETSTDTSANSAFDISRTVTPGAEEQPKSPEMQERNSNGGGSPFMPRRSMYLGSDHDPRDEQKTKRMMDMEMPDDQ